MRLRVAMVITRLHGGAGIVALRSALALAANSHRVTIITGWGDELARQALDAGVETVIEPSLRAPIAPVRDALAYRRLVELFRYRRFDVVHTHTAKAGVLGRRAAARVGVARIVHTYHGFPFHPFQSRVRSGSYVRIERRMGKVTDATLCVGDRVAAEAVRLGLAPPERVRAVAVPVDLGAPIATPSNRARARRELALPTDALVVGAVGRLTYQKAPEDFVATLDALPDREVLGVWIGGGELAADVRSSAERTLRPGKLVLTGERSDVLDLLPAFDIFALPSRYEGLPLALVEAMVCGLPVVATAVNAVPDLVIPGSTGLLVPPGRPDLMADCVGFLRDRPRTRARLAGRAARRIDDRFTIDALCEELAAAYTADEMSRR